MTKNEEDKMVNLVWAACLICILDVAYMWVREKLVKIGVHQ